jgi:hypothetical protein
MWLAAVWVLVLCLHMLLMYCCVVHLWYVCMHLMWQSSQQHSGYASTLMPDYVKV